MGERDLTLILQRIRQAAADVGGVSDGQLLDRFVSSQDQAAFELLLWRHARLVFGVCQRVLHNVTDAEDAFQATVLILARQAGRINKRDALASWLYKVAYRTAVTLRAHRTRRTAREQPLGPEEHMLVTHDDPPPVERAELREILDREVTRLPERFRAAVVLCYLEGKTVDEAAVQIGCPRGTLASRLARARERLRVRLAKRGLGLAAGLVALQEAGAASRPVSLIASVLPAAGRSASGAAADVSVSRGVVALTHEVLKAMFWHKIKTGIAVVFMSAALLLAGGGLAVHLRANAGAAQAAPDALAGDPSVAPAPDKQHAAGGAAAMISVRVSQPVRRDYVPYQDYIGRLEALQSVGIVSRVSGEVEKIAFKPGAEVKKGELLFDIDPRKYRLALEKAQAELESAEAQRELANKALERARRLRKAGSIGNEDYEKITADALKGDANWKVALRAVEEAKLNMSAARLTAPVDGVIGEPQPLVGLGVHVSQNQSLATITTVDPIRFVFNMDERSFLRYRRLLREGAVKETGVVVAMGLADEAEFPRKGVLERFDVRFDPRTGMVRVYANFPNRDRMLLPGMSGRVRFPFGEVRSVLEVPEDAIWGQDGSSNLDRYVFVVGNNDTLERRAVKLSELLWISRHRIVDRGLSASDWVVVSNPNDLRVGQRVKVERSSKPDAKAAPAKK